MILTQEEAALQKTDVSAQTDVPIDVMEPVKKVDALNQTEEMPNILAIRNPIRTYSINRQ